MAMILKQKIKIVEKKQKNFLQMIMIINIVFLLHPEAL